MKTYCKNCNQSYNKGYFNKHCKTKKHLKINSYNFNSNDFNCNLGEDVDNIIKGFIFDLEGEKRTNEHKEKFSECIEDINIIGIKNNLDMIYEEEDIDLIEWVRTDDFNCNFEDYKDYRFDNDYVDWLDSEEEGEDEEIKKTFIIDVVEDDWKIMIIHWERMNNYLNKRFINDRGYYELREFCLDEGLY